jgi:hypothetical protein
VFVPLAHPPGHGQVDFGEAMAIVDGVAMKVHLFCMDLPHSDAMDPLSSYQPRHWYCQGPSHSRYISVALSNANVGDGV